MVMRAYLQLSEMISRDYFGFNLGHKSGEEDRSVWLVLEFNKSQSILQLWINRYFGMDFLYWSHIF